MSAPVDVLAVMAIDIDCIEEMGESAAELRAARDAIEELIEAAWTLRGKRGAIMALTQTDPRSVRFFAALARVGGAK